MQPMDDGYAGISPEYLFREIRTTIVRSCQSRDRPL
jgi:hypothetical protein